MHANYLIPLRSSVASNENDMSTEEKLEFTINGEKLKAKSTGGLLRHNQQSFDRQNIKRSKHKYVVSVAPICVIEAFAGVPIV